MRIHYPQRKQRDKLSPDCESELFRKEVEDADDIRLSVRLFQACLPDKKQFCADVPPGGARASQCLEEHREKLSEGCRCGLWAFVVAGCSWAQRGVHWGTAHTPLASFTFTLLSKCMSGGKQQDDGCASHAPKTHPSDSKCLWRVLHVLCIRVCICICCRTEMDSMIERRVRDFRLDTRLKSACENTIMDMCSYLGDVTVVDTYDSAVANCLQVCRGWEPALALAVTCMDGRIRPQAEAV